MKKPTAPAPTETAPPTVVDPAMPQAEDPMVVVEKSALRLAVQVLNLAHQKGIFSGVAPDEAIQYLAAISYLTKLVS